MSDAMTTANSRTVADALARADELRNEIQRTVTMPPNIYGNDYHSTDEELTIIALADEVLRLREQLHAQWWFLHVERCDDNWPCEAMKQGWGCRWPKPEGVPDEVASAE